MFTLRPVLYEISGESSKVLFTACHDDLSDYAAEVAKLPRGLYTVSAPYIGSSRREIGLPLPRDAYFPELTTVIQTCFDLGMETLSRAERIEKEEIVKRGLQKYEIAYSVIHQLYTNILRNQFPMSKFVDIFIFLEKNGALWYHIPFPNEDSVLERNRVVFKGLIQQVFGADKATEVLGSVTIGDPPAMAEQHKTGFSYLRKEIDFFLSLGANLNGVSPEHPEFGTFLHRYLAYENPYGSELIDLLESKRKADKPHTHFNYCQQDGEGKTPLLIAIATRNTKVIFKLLGLSQKNGIDIGIDIPNREGQTPLMLACAFGLHVVVQALLRQKANTSLTDTQSRTYQDYLRLPEDELLKVLSMMVHPERGSKVNHSYVYAHDAGRSPYCIYKDGERAVSGSEQTSHFVVLSPLPKHQARIQIVLDVLLRELKKVGIKKKDDPKAKRIRDEIEFVKHQNTQALSTKKTFLEECLEGQKAVLTVIESASSVTSIAATTDEEQASSSLGGGARVESIKEKFTTIK